jgi:5-formyltetrahydrofolate cyclo-ligase
MFSTPAHVKRALRRIVRDRILALEPTARAREEAELLRRVPELPGFVRAATLLLYARAFPEEIDTGPLLRDALSRGRRLVLPRVDRRAKHLVLHHVADLRRDLAPGVLGIPEPLPTCPIVDPREIDWALVPGLAFDARGYRLGRGAGHYDRLLPKLREDVPRWALALSPQWVEALPVEPHDQRLDGIAGDERTYVDCRDRPGFSEDSG